MKRTACSLFRWSIYNSRVVCERAMCVRRNCMRRGRRRDNCESTLAHSDSHTLPHWLSQSWPPLFSFTSGISPRHPCLAEFGSTFGYFWIKLTCLAYVAQKINRCNVMFDLSIDYVPICQVLVNVVFEYWARENGWPSSLLPSRQFADSVGPTRCWPIRAADAWRTPRGNCRLTT